MLSSPSGVTSATIATIFDVPMSRPTITFFVSFTIASSLLLPRNHFAFHAAAFFCARSRNPGTRAANPLR